MWKAVGASVAGTSHGSNGTPCQDANRYRVNGQILICALSDGAGSASHSHIGSQIATRIALLHLAKASRYGRMPCKEDLEAAGEAALIAIERAAKKRGLENKSLACTLLLAAASKEKSIFYQLGDGGWVVRSGDSLLPVTWPLRGEYANETTFLTTVGWKRKIQVEEFPLPIDAVAGFTDGIQMLALHYATRSVHSPFVAPLLKVLDSSTDAYALRGPLAGFLSTDSINERTDDDKTLIVAIRKELRFLQWPTSTKIVSQ